MLRLVSFSIVITAYRIIESVHLDSVHGNGLLGVVDEDGGSPFVFHFHDTFLMANVLDNPLRLQLA
ncbi:hypothetical protein D3C81_2203880 [compost metagenome]